MSASWHLQDAKNNLSKLVQLARDEGPQTITLRGKPAAVVIDAAQFERLKRKTRTLVDHILSGPEWDDDVIEEINRRPKSGGRPVNF